MSRILLCRIVPADSSQPDIITAWIPDTVVVLGQYVTNFCHKIVHCPFKYVAQGSSDNIRQKVVSITKNLRIRLNFVLMCRMSGRLVVCVSQYLNIKQMVLWL